MANGWEKHQKFHACELLVLPIVLDGFSEQFQTQSGNKYAHLSLINTLITGIRVIHLRFDSFFHIYYKIQDSKLT